MTQPTYDVVVIGGGCAGLTTAALLGKRGMRVLLLEARPQLGGLTSTEELAPGVRCDVVDHELGWIPPAVVSELALLQYGLELLRLDPCASAFSASGEVITLYPNVQRTAEGLTPFSAADARAWPDFALRVSRLSSFLQALYEVPAPSLFSTGAANLVSMLGLGRKARSLGRSGIFDLLRTLPMSIADVLDETFEHASLKAMLAARAVTRILQGPRSGATAFLFLHHHVGRPEGSVYGGVTARGGVGAATRVLVLAAKSHGVTLRTSARVSRINVHNAQVRGVVLESGEEIAAANVLSSVDPRHTIYDLMDPADVEPEVSRAVGNVRFRGATAKVNVVLDGPVPLTAPNAAEVLRGRIVLAPSMSQLERSFDRAKHGTLPEEFMLEVRVPGVPDASMKAGDRSVLSVLVQWAPYRLKTGWDSAVSDALGDRVLQQLERSFPGLTSRVVQRQVLTPVDIEREYGATEGSLTHGELTLDQILFMRPVPAFSRYRSPNIAGLYLCGRGCHPGMAFPAALLAAREVTRQTRSGRKESLPAPPAA